MKTATHREHPTRPGGHRRRLRESVHDDVESVIILAGIRNLDRNVNRDAIERARKTIPEGTRTCGECKTLWLTSEQGNSCPSCGWKSAPRSKAVEVQPADLEEMADELAIQPNDPQVARFFQEALGYRSRHSPQKWAANPKGMRWACWCAVQEKFKLTQEKPPARFWDLPVLPAGLEVQGWMKYRDIRWARSKSRAA